jgi:CheY-like chemotaxis protein
MPYDARATLFHSNLLRRRFLLPLIPSKAPRGAISVNTPLPASGPRRVLLVDDDAISLELVALLLGHDGHEVIRASNGEAALELLLKLLKNTAGGALPDVILVDMQMPGVSGREVARKVQVMDGRKPLLLAMSATQVGEEELHGFDGFLLKPMALDDLRRALALGKRSRGLEAGRDRAKRRAALSQEAAATDLINPMDSLDPIDKAVLRKLESAMPPAALQELYEVCVADTRSRAGKLKNQVIAGDMTEVPRGGHQIKGAASMVGFTRVARLAASLELGSCKEEDTLHLLDDLLSSCDELERILLAGKP